MRLAGRAAFSFASNVAGNFLAGRLSFLAGRPGARYFQVVSDRRLSGRGRVPPRRWTERCLRSCRFGFAQAGDPAPAVSSITQACIGRSRCGVGAAARPGGSGGQRASRVAAVRSASLRSNVAGQIRRVELLQALAQQCLAIRTEDFGCSGGCWRTQSRRQNRQW